MGRGIAPLFSRTFGTRWGWGVSPTPRPPLPPGKTGYPFYRRLGGPHGRSGRVRKVSPLPGFDPRTVQPVAQSLYRLSYRAPLEDYLMYVKRDKCKEQLCPQITSREWNPVAYSSLLLLPQLYNSLWVLACSFIPLHGFLSCAFCFQLFTPIFLKSSLTSSSYLHLGLPFGLAACDFHL